MWWYENDHTPHVLFLPGKASVWPETGLFFEIKNLKKA